MTEFRDMLHSSQRYSQKLSVLFLDGLYFNACRPVFLTIDYVYTKPFVEKKLQMGVWDSYHRRKLL